MYGAVQKEQNQAGGKDQSGVFPESYPIVRICPVQERNPKHDEKIPEYGGETASDKGHVEGSKAHKCGSPVENQQTGKVDHGADQGMEPFRREPSGRYAGFGKGQGNVNGQKNPQAVYKNRKKI